MNRNKGFTYASMVALVCAISLLWISLVPNQVFAAEKSAGINTTEGAKQSPLPPDWKIKNFKTGKSDITDAIANQLQPVLDYYNANPKDLLIVQPWVSELKYARNNYERQNELAKNRGMAVREYLVDHGVPRDHIVILYMYGISIEPGTNFANQQVTVWHATHPELKNGGTQIISSCEQQSCPVPELKDPIVNVNIPDCATKTIERTKDSQGNLVFTVNVNVDKCSKEIIKEVNRGNWCAAHKAACAFAAVSSKSCAGDSAGSSASSSDPGSTIELGPRAAPPSSASCRSSQARAFHAAQARTCPER